MNKRSDHGSMARKLGLLFVLYVVQGVPYGLQISTLPTAPLRPSFSETEN